MQKYEEMFFNNKEELEKLIIELVEKSIDDDADAQKELDAIKEQIAYAYEIRAKVEFELECSVGSGTAKCESIQQYNDLKEKTEESCLCAYELDGWVAIDMDEFGTAYMSGREVNVQFHGIGNSASTEAKEAFEEIYKKQEQEKAKAEAELRIMRTEVMIANLQEKLIADKEELENLSSSVTIA